MNKVISKDFRTLKELQLPTSGITLNCYSSLLIGDLSNIPKDQSDLDSNLSIVIKVIKEWNFYEKTEDESPLPITLENIKKLPAPDFHFLVNSLKEFSNDQKKT